MEWISVKDRLPEIEEEVWVFWRIKKKDEEGYWEYQQCSYIYSITQYKSYQNVEWSGGIDGVTHWMPKPPSPKFD